MTDRPTFKASVDVQLMLRALMDSQVGDVVTYTDLDALIGRDCRTNGIQSAKYMAEREGVIFGAVNNVGYKRLSDSEIVALGGLATRHIYRTAVRTTSKLTKVADYAALSPADQLRHNVSLTTMTLAAYSTNRAGQKGIEKQVSDSQAALPAAKAAVAALGNIDSVAMK